MKTAMQELMSFVNSFQEETIHPRILRVKVNELLEKEKEQIMKAYKDHHALGHIFGLDTEQYYNQTYNQNK